MEQQRGCKATVGATVQPPLISPCLVPPETWIVLLDRTVKRERESCRASPSGLKIPWQTAAWWRRHQRRQAGRRLKKQHKHSRHMSHNQTPPSAHETRAFGDNPSAVEDISHLGDNAAGLRRVNLHLQNSPGGPHRPQKLIFK